ncbi:hypothetical protein L1887_32164 [Cichorium endivia]|nr:hypothetical protein L1887_32164 [Cichorium endivia]
MGDASIGEMKGRLGEWTEVRRRRATKIDRRFTQVITFFVAGFQMGRGVGIYGKSFRSRKSDVVGYGRVSTDNRQTVDPYSEIQMQLSEIELSISGGLRVIIDLGCSLTATEFCEERNKWADSFHWVRVWEDKAFTYERVAWLKILCFPLRLWDEENFSTICSRFGKVLCPFDSIYSWNDLSMGKVGILTSARRWINEEVQDEDSDGISDTWIDNESNKSMEESEEEEGEIQEDVARAGNQDEGELATSRIGDTREVCMADVPIVNHPSSSADPNRPVDALCDEPTFEASLDVNQNPCSPSTTRGSVPITDESSSSTNEIEATVAIGKEIGFQIDMDNDILVSLLGGDGANTII